MPTLVLMYHDVSEASHEVPAGHRPYVIDPERFGIQMRSVGGRLHPTMTVRQWCALRPTQPAIVLTFDDGHVSNYENALPILVDCGLTATFFVTAGLIGTGNTMNWSQIRALHAAGMEIGSHTVTHRPPALLSDAELRDELVESRRILEDGLGTDVVSISSPTGFFNPRMRAIARETGYSSLCTGRVGLVRDQADPFSLNRVAVKQTLSHEAFAALLRFDRLTLGRMRSHQLARQAARLVLGVKPYLTIRRLIIGEPS